MKKILGVFTFLVGSLLLGWMVFCFATDRPEIEEYNPLLPIGVAACFIYVGLLWMGFVGNKETRNTRPSRSGGGIGSAVAAAAVSDRALRCFRRRCSISSTRGGTGCEGFCG